PTPRGTGPLRRPNRNSKLEIRKFNGGEGGIRTHVSLSAKPHFECGAIDHSATSPALGGVTVRRRGQNGSRNLSPDAPQARLKPRPRIADHGTTCALVRQQP